MNRRFSFATLALTVALLGAGVNRLQGQSAQPVNQPASQVKAATTADPQAATKTDGAAKPETVTKADPSSHSHGAGQSQATTSETRSKPRLTADQAYKANCTRCHSELPKLQPGGMATVLMHMRVRANLPKDEARTILEYLTR